MISIIIITYDRVNDLIDLLKNLENQTFHDFEVIVVDNNSQDGTREIIPRDFPHVKYILSKTNLGVPAGRNLGVKNAVGDILVFIDNDALLHPKALSSVSEIYDTNPEIGILAFKILNYFTKELDLTTWVFNEHLKTVTNLHPVNTFVGAGFAIHRKVFNKIGLLWDDLFFMHEEKDFSFRALNAGFKIVYVPWIEVYHKVSPQRRFESNERFFYYGIRNEIWIYIKNIPWRFTVPHLFFLFWAGGLYALRLGYFKYFLKGYYDGLLQGMRKLSMRHPVSEETYKLYLKLLDKRKDPWLKRIQRFFKAGR